MKPSDELTDDQKEALQEVARTGDEFYRQLIMENIDEVMNLPALKTKAVARSLFILGVLTGFAGHVVSKGYTSKEHMSQNLQALTDVIKAIHISNANTPTE